MIPSARRISCVHSSMVERTHEKREAVGSTPTRASIYVTYLINHIKENCMSRNVERVVTVIVSVVMIIAFFVLGRTGANATIDNAQATADALSGFLTELAVQETEAPPAATSTPPELAETQAPATIVPTVAATKQPTKRPTKAPTRTPAPTSTPEFCYPSNLDEVVVIRDPRLNLWDVIGENKAGKFIMDIYEDDDGNRVQYAVGTTFFVYEEGIVVDGGKVFYDVFGPLGGDLDLYAKGDHIKLFDDTPDDLLYCE